MLLRDQRRAKIIALAAVTAFTALLVTLILVLDGGDSPTAGTEAPEVQGSRQPTAQPGVRYDGGPEEGTRGVVPDLRAGVRHDGGPEEGSRGRFIAPSRGSLSVPPFPETRYDGGPEEGSRGSGH
jgi:hypothetical protein